MLAQKLGIFDQSQLESLIPNQIEKAEPKPKTPQKTIKKTPMRVVISLLLQNSQLVNRISDVGLQALKHEAGYELLEKLTALCREREGITMVKCPV